MTERALIRRELVRQTALLFFVFALLFALLGAGVYSMVSSNIYRNADENLQAIGMESDYNPRCRRQRIRDRRRRRGRRARRRRPLRRHGDRRPLPHASAEHRGRRSAVHHAHTKRAGRPSRDRGAVRLLSFLPAPYPLRQERPRTRLPDCRGGSRVPRHHVCGKRRRRDHVSSDAGERRLGDRHSRRLHAHVDRLLGGSRRRGSGRKLLAFAAHAQTPSWRTCARRRNSCRTPRTSCARRSP